MQRTHKVKETSEREKRYKKTQKMKAKLPPDYRACEAKTGFLFYIGEQTSVMVHVNLPCWLNKVPFSQIAVSAWV